MSGSEHSINPVLLAVMSEQLQADLRGTVIQMRELDLSDPIIVKFIAGITLMLLNPSVLPDDQEAEEHFKDLAHGFNAALLGYYQSVHNWEAHSHSGFLLEQAATDTRRSFSVTHQRKMQQKGV